MASRKTTTVVGQAHRTLCSFCRETGVSRKDAMRHLSATFGEGNVPRQHIRKALKSLTPATSSR